MPILNATTRAPYKNKGEFSCLQGTRRDKYKPTQAGWEEEERTPPASNHPRSTPPPLCLGTPSRMPRGLLRGPGGYCFCSFPPVGPDPHGSLNLRAKICSGSDRSRGEAHPPIPTPPEEYPMGLSGQG